LKNTLTWEEIKKLSSNRQEHKTKVGLKLTEVESQMIFKCDMGNIKVNDCYIDEEQDSESEKIGPNPSRLLALAVLGCLSASFIFCLKKKNFRVEDFDAEAEIIIKHNPKGFWRVQQIDVNINPKIEDANALKRAKQCLKTLSDDISFFEQYCIVTQSVREGVKVNVNVNV